MANRILVVDDNSDIRENICEYLNLRGHQTIGASDAASAAQLIAEEDIALIVLDVGLPGEDGMSFCRRLRLAGSSILILMLTALDKPFNVPMLKTHPGAGWSVCAPDGVKG